VRYAGAGSFFWFSIDGKSYITRDPNVLRRVKDVYRPVFETGADFTVGEQLGLFAKRANASAARLNDYNARMPEINRRIEVQLRAIGVRLVEQRIAVEAK